MFKILGHYWLICASNSVATNDWSKVKPVLNGHSKIDKTKVLMTNGLMKVKSIAECSPWCILQYFWPALSHNRSWKPIFVFFLSGRLRQVLLYLKYLLVSLKMFHRNSNVQHWLCCDGTKPVLGASYKATLKIEISPVASLDMICSKKWITKALISLRRLVSDFVKIGSLASRPNYLVMLKVYDMGLVATTLSSGYPTKSDSNQPAQLQRLARKLKFRLLQVFI